MTEPSGAELGEATGGTPPPADAPPESIDSLLLAGLRDGSAAPPPPPPSDDSNSDDSLPPLGDVEEPQSNTDETLTAPPPEETPQGEQPENPEIDGWGREVVRKSQRISEVPTARRAQVLDSAFRHVQQNTLEAIKGPLEEVIQRREAASYQNGFQAAQQMLIADGEYAEVEQLRREAPAAYADLRDVDPGKWSRYVARVDGQQRQEAAQQDPMQAAIMAAAAPIMKRLEANPEAKALLAEKERAHRAATGRLLYGPDAEGLDALVGDATEALARPPARREDPSARQAQERQQAAAQRQPGPRTATRESAGIAAGGSQGLSNDIDTLLKDGWKDSLTH